MCIFSGRRPTAVHALTHDQAKVGYKELKLNDDVDDRRGIFKSPYQTTFYWETALAPASFPGTLGNSGIYVMKSTSGAINSGRDTRGSVIVKVAVWGVVYEYGFRDEYGRTGYAGYRAERCEILEVLPPQRGPRSYYGWRRPPRRLWGLRLSHVKRVLPLLRKRYPSVKFPTNRELGLS